MTIISFISGLKSILPETYWACVIPALQYDPTIWQSFRGKFGQSVLSRNSTHLEDFTPAAISLFALEYPGTIDNIRQDPLQSIDIDQLNIHSESEELSEICKAGLNALKIREMRLTYGTWHETINSLNDISPTTLSCLFGMVPDSTDLLLEISTSKFSGQNLSHSFDLILHAIWSNPLSEEDQVELFLEFLDGLTTDKQEDLLNSISIIKPKLVSKLADGISIDEPSLNCVELNSTDDYIYHLSTLNKAFKRNRIIDRKDKAYTIINQSLVASRRMQANYLAETARLAYQNDDPIKTLNAWEKAATLDPNSMYILGCLVLTLLDVGRVEDAYLTLQERVINEPNPLISLTRSKLDMISSDYENARDNAIDAHNLIHTQLNQHKGIDHIPASYMIQLIDLLLEFRLPTHSIEAIESVLHQQPHDPDLIGKYAMSWAIGGGYLEAMEQAYLAISLAPNRSDLHKKLIDTLELGEEWDQAYHEQTCLIERLDTTTNEDLIKLGGFALNSGQYEKAIQVCEKVLREENENLDALTLIGETKFAMNELDLGIEYLNRAIDLNPKVVDPWLALSRSYVNNGEIEQALETLNLALLSNPSRPEIHYAIGELFLSQEAETQALHALRKAAHLIAYQSGTGDKEPKSLYMLSFTDKVLTKLGYTLRYLGHIEEARQVIETAYQNSPFNPQTAYEYARVLLILGEDKHSLQPLRTVLKSDIQDTKPYLDFATIAIKLHSENQEEFDIDEVVDNLKKVFAIEPQNLEAMALLGEAYSVTNKLQAALEIYQEALSAGHLQDSRLQSRLNLGLGIVSLKLGLTETALASLLEANQADPLNPEIQKYISEAYEATGFIEDSYQSAHSTLLLAQDDINILCWFSEQVLQLQEKNRSKLPQAASEALNAIDRASQIAPERGDVWVQYGGTLMMMERNDEATQAFQKLVSPTGVSIESSSKIYYQAAQGLLQLGDPASAVKALQLALNLFNTEKDPTEISKGSILKELALAHFLAGDLRESLNILDQAIPISPQDIQLYKIKSEVLLQIGQSQNQQKSVKVYEEALSSIHKSLQIDPDDHKSHACAAKIYRARGNLPVALTHALKEIELLTDSATALIKSRVRAASIALAMLQNELATELLNVEINTDNLANPADYIDFYCLRAEIELDKGNDQISADELKKVFELAPDHPYALALQTRLKTHGSNNLEAIETVHRLLDTVSQNNTWDIDSLRAISKAALDLQQWTTAINKFERICEYFPHEPSAYYYLVRALVLQAEHQRLYQQLNVVQRAPGEHALSDTIYTAFNFSIQKTEEFLTKMHELILQDGTLHKMLIDYQDRSQIESEIKRWKLRGEAVFSPNKENAEDLQSLSINVEDTSALVACKREIGDISGAVVAARKFPQNPLVLLQLSLALEKDKPKQSLAASQTAFEALGKSTPFPLSGDGFSLDTTTACLYKLVARLTFRMGDTYLEDAFQSIHSALEIWPDEPRWHSFAAEICSRRALISDNHENDNALNHLQEAVNLDPEYAQNYLALANFYLENGDTHEAIAILENATRLTNIDHEIWLLLAQTYKSIGDLDKAASSAEKATLLAPDHIESIILYGEISLEANNPRGAQNKALTALRLNPKEPDALILLARALEAQNRPDEAIAALDNAALETDSPLPILIERTRLLYNSDKEQAALQAIQDLAGRFPNEPAVLAMLAEALEEAGNNEAAIQNAQRALKVGLEKNGDQPTINKSNIHCLLGRLLRQSGQLDQAIFHLHEATNLAPHSINPYLELGKTYQERREYKNALEAFRQAIDNTPTDYRGYLQMGLALKDNRDYMGAERMLRRAAELAPKDVNINKTLAAVVALNLIHNRRSARKEIHI